MAVLFKLFDFSQNHSTRLSPAQVAKMFNANISEKRAELALRALERRKHVYTSYSSNGTSASDITEPGYRIVEAALNTPKDFFYEYRMHGDPWLARADADLAGVPASDRIVTLNHNDPDYISIRRELSEITEAARSINDTDISAEQRDRINKGLASASELWGAAELKLMQVKIGVVMTIEDAKPIFKETVRLLAIDTLIAAIKAFIKATTGVDIENVF
jgi:hypothetical protein